MAKLTGPLMSLKAGGAISKAIIFRERAGVSYASKFYQLGGLAGRSATASQQAVRERYGEAVGAWRLLTVPEQAEYNERAISLNISGYNLFIKEYDLYDTMRPTFTSPTWNITSDLPKTWHFVPAGKKFVLISVIIRWVSGILDDGGNNLYFGISPSWGENSYPLGLFGLFPDGGYFIPDIMTDAKVPFLTSLDFVSLYVDAPMVSGTVLVNVDLFGYYID